MEQASLVIDFVKMNGCGNDFVVIDARKPELEGLELTARQVQTIAARSNTITKGCDQVLIIRPPKEKATVFTESHNTFSMEGRNIVTREIPNTAFMEIRNADGVQVEACGNGSRAVAAYLADNDDTLQTGFIETLGGPLVYNANPIMAGNIAIKETKRQTFVTIIMPLPKRTWKNIPLNEEIDDTARVQLHDDLPPAFLVNLGNPHAVFFITGETETFARHYGAALEQHPLFSARANINFARIESDISKWVPDKYEADFSIPPDNVIELSTWERGVNLTKSCGTGACATAIAYHHLYSQKSGTVTGVSMEGGILKIIYDPTQSLLEMGGRAVFEFNGKITLNDKVAI